MISVTDRYHPVKIFLMQIQIFPKYCSRLQLYLSEIVLCCVRNDPLLDNNPRPLTPGAFIEVFTRATSCHKPRPALTTEDSESPVHEKGD